MSSRIHHRDRIGAALVLASLAALGVLLAAFAAPLPVRIASIVIAVVAGSAAFRLLPAER